MTMRSWQVGSLIPVECYLPPDLAQWATFRHLGTTVRGPLAGDSRRVGDTVWGGVREGREVAIAWDWLEIMPGVVCLLDPNSICTNIRFMDANDCYQEPLQAIISANRLVYRWAWQPIVLNALANAESGNDPVVAQRAIAPPPVSSEHHYRKAA